MPIKGAAVWNNVHQRLRTERIDRELWDTLAYDLTKLTFRKKGHLWLMVVTIESEDGRKVLFLEDTTVDNCLQMLVEEIMFNKQFKKQWHRSKY